MSVRSSMIRLDAGHTLNGNPRRAYLHLRGFSIVGVYPEGYRGSNAVPARLRHLARCCATIATTPAQYRALLRGRED